MEPQYDPEARIRELERPLADSARASEAGGTHTSGRHASSPDLPAPLPPSSYGDRLPGTSRRSRSGKWLWWVLAAFVVIDAVFLAGGIAAYSAHRHSRGGVVTLSPAPSVSPTSPAPSAGGTQPPGPGPSTSPTAVPTPPADANLNVSGISQSQTISCDNNSVSVSGISNRVVIGGHCTRLTVSGVQNSVNVDAVDTIEASGFNNHVIYHTGSPSIDNADESNVVQQG